MDTTQLTMAELQRLLHARELSATDLLSEHMSGSTTWTARSRRSFALTPRAGVGAGGGRPIARSRRATPGRSRAFRSR